MTQPPPPRGPALPGLPPPSPPRGNWASRNWRRFRSQNPVVQILGWVVAIPVCFVVLLTALGLTLEATGNTVDHEKSSAKAEVASTVPAVSTSADVAPTVAPPTQSIEPFLSEEQVWAYADHFIPTREGLAFCRLLYGKNTLTQVAIAGREVRGLPLDVSGKKASDTAVYAIFQTDCDLTYSEAVMR